MVTRAIEAWHGALDRVGEHFNDRAGFYTTLGCVTVAAALVAGVLVMMSEFSRPWAFVCTTICLVIAVRLPWR